MNPSQSKSHRHQQRRLVRQQQHKRLVQRIIQRLLPPPATATSIFLPYDLITQVFSFLPVKSLIRLKCLNKSWNSLISEPTFIKLHLHRSSQNAEFTFLQWDSRSRIYSLSFFLPARMLKNSSPVIITLPKRRYHRHRRQTDDKECLCVVGSCNGLLCLSYHCLDKNGYTKWWFRVWNPATRTISEKLGSCHDDPDIGYNFNFRFGYDNSENTFKVLRFFPNTTEVRVFNLRDNIWRNIQNSPVALYDSRRRTEVVHLNNSVSWLTICNYTRKYYCNDITIQQFVIISLDLHTETHTKLLPPQGFNEVPCYIPTLSVLNGCLCFSHDFRQTHFTIWTMNYFGVEASWIQFLNISYHNLRIPHHNDFYFGLLPICFLEKNTLLLTYNTSMYGAFLYNWRDNTARSINKPWWLFCGKDYVESLVWYC